MFKSTRKIVISGVMAAMLITLGLLPQGFIPTIFGVSLTPMHVPVIIGAVLEGPVVGFVLGLIFGAFSFLQAAIAPRGPGDVLFTNPVVSILPRLFIGPVAWAVYELLRRIKEPLAMAAAGVAGSLTNTILVLGVIGLLHLLPWTLIGGLALTNGPVEAAVAAVLTLAVVAAVKHIETGRRGSTV